MRKRIAAALLSAAAIGTTLLALGSSTPAQAIPTLAQSCTTNAVTGTPADGWQQLGSPVWVNNSAGFRRTVVNLNADAQANRNGGIVVAYRVDPSGPLVNPGARHLVSHGGQQLETRHAMTVLPISQGWHRVFVYWRVTGGPLATGTIAGRCLTVEGNTA